MNDYSLKKLKAISKEQIENLQILNESGDTLELKKYLCYLIGLTEIDKYSLGDTAVRLSEEAKINDIFEMTFKDRRTYYLVKQILGKDDNDNVLAFAWNLF